MAKIAEELILTRLFYHQCEQLFCLCDVCSSPLYLAESIPGNLPALSLTRCVSDADASSTPTHIYSDRTRDKICSGNNEDPGPDASPDLVALFQKWGAIKPFGAVVPAPLSSRVIKQLYILQLRGISGIPF